MIRYVQGDLFETNDPVIVHGCNAQGVMGKGVAKIVREKWPRAFEVYRAKFEQDGLKPGEVIMVGVGEGYSIPYIANAITQDFYANKNGDPGVFVDYNALRECMKYIGDWCNFNAFVDISMPKIGAGLGGGDWNRIEEIINEELADFNVTVYTI